MSASFATEVPVQAKHPQVRYYYNSSEKNQKTIFIFGRTILLTDVSVSKMKKPCFI